MPRLLARVQLPETALPRRNPYDPSLDWISDSTDTADTYHESLTARLIPSKLDLMFAGNYSYALGRVETSNPNADGSTVYNAVATTNEVARPWPAFEDSLLPARGLPPVPLLEVPDGELEPRLRVVPKHDRRTDTIKPFVPSVSAVYLGNDVKNYEAHIFGVTIGYPFK